MAQYIEGDDRNQSMLLPAAIDGYVSPASPVRAIIAFVDQLDLAASGVKIRSDSSEGRSSYDPATRSFTKTKIDKLIEGIDKAISRYVTDLAEADEANSSLKSNGLYHDDAFIHDFARDSYTCPQGEVLTRKADTKPNAPTGGFRTYYNSSAGKACPARAQCTKSTIRKLIISVHLETMDRARGRLAAVPDAMRQRAALVEHPFGTLKDRHGYADCSAEVCPWQEPRWGCAPGSTTSPG